MHGCQYFWSYRPHVLTFRLSRYCIWCRFLDLHHIELPLSAVRSLTLVTLQPQIWYDGALTGQMCNPCVLHLSEGQTDEKPGSVVSHFWPWLQVIKALLSFCQSSDSPNISPWLISAVSSVRVYTKPWKDQQPARVFTIHLSIPPLKSRPRSTLISSILVRLLCIATNVSSSVMSRYCASTEHRRACLSHWWKLRIYCGLRWASCDFVK